MILSPVGRLFPAAVALAAVVATPADAAVSIGSTTVVVRTVTGTLERDIRTLVVRDRVSQNEVIATEPDAASEIVFEDGTNLTLGPNAKVTLDKFVYDPDPSRGAFFLTLTEGVLRFVTGSLAHQAYSIATPNGTIGVRGTDIYISVTCGTQESTGSTEKPAKPKDQATGLGDQTLLAATDCSTSLGSFQGEAVFTDLNGTPMIITAGGFVTVGAGSPGSTQATEAGVQAALAAALAQISFQGGVDVAGTSAGGRGGGPGGNLVTPNSLDPPALIGVNSPSSPPPR